MAMPLAGTFDYAGLVPGKTEFQSGRWQLKERSWAALPGLRFAERYLGLGRTVNGSTIASLVYNRRCGFVENLILEAAGRDWRRYGRRRYRSTVR